MVNNRPVYFSFPLIARSIERHSVSLSLEAVDENSTFGIKFKDVRSRLNIESMFNSFPDTIDQLLVDDLHRRRVSWNDFEVVFRRVTFENGQAFAKACKLYNFFTHFNMDSSVHGFVPSIHCYKIPVEFQQDEALSQRRQTVHINAPLTSYLISSRIPRPAPLSPAHTWSSMSALTPMFLPANMIPYVEEPNVNLNQLNQPLPTPTDLPPPSILNAEFLGIPFSGEYQQREYRIQQLQQLSHEVAESVIQVKKCCVCMDEATETITSGCNRHHMCFECMDTYMRQPSENHPINTMTKLFQCPFDGCTATFDLNKVKQVIKPSTLSYLEDHLAKLSESGMSLPCQACGYINKFDLCEPSLFNQNDPRRRLAFDTKQTMQCKGCARDICLKCAVTMDGDKGLLPLTKRQRTDGYTCKTIRWDNNENPVSVSIRGGCECYGITLPAEVGPWSSTPSFYNRTGWFRCARRSGENVPHLYQVREINKEVLLKIAKEIIFNGNSLLFHTRCGACDIKLERSEACTELKHCGVSICSCCGYRSVPGEPEIPSGHWKTCFRYEDDLAEYYGLQNSDSVGIREVRHALHLIRLFIEVPRSFRQHLYEYMFTNVFTSSAQEPELSSIQSLQRGLLYIVLGKHFQDFSDTALYHIANSICESPELLVPKRAYHDDEDSESSGESE